ncbi:MAG: Bug family tripartite tricarboxylate transporter substrate binding protein [bacterium]|jgi:tripartite-type tricarboxylate transporter receptor subunit TctC
MSPSTAITAAASPAAPVRSIRQRRGGVPIARCLRPLPAVAAIGLALAMQAVPSTAQEWPQRPSRVIVPFSAGGNTDSIARISAEWLTARLGQNVIVENRPGASGSIATELVARAPADGYTMLMGTPTQLAIYPAMAKVPYDAVRDFAPMSIVGTNPYGLGVHPSLPVKSLKDLVALAKTRPGAMPYGSAGTGAGTHLTMAMFLSRAGIEMNHIPYKGGSVAVAELVGGQVVAYFGNVAEIVPHARSGRVRALAVSGLKRSPQLPEVPTVAEQGYPGFEAFTWNGLLAPAKTPPAVVARVAKEIAAATRDPAVIKRLDAMGVEPLGNTPAEFSRVLADSITLYAEVVRVSGAKAE